MITISMMHIIKMISSEIALICIIWLLQQVEAGLETRCKPVELTFLERVWQSLGWTIARKFQCSAEVLFKKRCLNIIHVDETIMIGVVVLVSVVGCLWSTVHFKVKERLNKARASCQTQEQKLRPGIEGLTRVITDIEGMTPDTELSPDIKGPTPNIKGPNIKEPTPDRPLSRKARKKRSSRQRLQAFLESIKDQENSPGNQEG